MGECPNRETGNSWLKFGNKKKERKVKSITNNDTDILCGSAVWIKGNVTDNQNMPCT